MGSRFSVIVPDSGFECSITYVWLGTRTIVVIGTQDSYPVGANLWIYLKIRSDELGFQGEPGQVYSVITQFGVHLIEITDQVFESTDPSIQVASLSRPIIPSQETQDEIKEYALQLQEENTTIDAMRTAAAGKGYTVSTSPAVKANDFSLLGLGTGQGAREMIKWAFGTSQNIEPAVVGQVSPQIYSFQNPGEYHVSKYAVAALQSIRPAGIPSYQDVKSDMEADVINRKKAEVLKSQLSGMTDLQSIASKYSTKVDTATNVAYAAATIPGAGSEPKVVAEAFKADLNQASAAVAGNSGVYVVLPTNKPAPAPANATFTRQTAQISDRGQVGVKLMPSLRKNADITDNRSRFF